MLTNTLCFDWQCQKGDRGAHQHAVFWLTVSERGQRCQVLHAHIWMRRARPWSQLGHTSNRTGLLCPCRSVSFCPSKYYFFLFFFLCCCCSSSSIRSSQNHCLMYNCVHFHPTPPWTHTHTHLRTEWAKLSHHRKWDMCRTPQLTLILWLCVCVCVGGGGVVTDILTCECEDRTRPLCDTNNLPPFSLSASWLIKVPAAYRVVGFGGGGVGGMCTLSPSLLRHPRGTNLSWSASLGISKQWRHSPHSSLYDCSPPPPHTPNTTTCLHLFRLHQQWFHLLRLPPPSSHKHSFLNSSPPPPPLWWSARWFKSGAASIGLYFALSDGS